MYFQLMKALLAKKKEKEFNLKREIQNRIFKDSIFQGLIEFIVGLITRKK